MTARDWNQSEVLYAFAGWLTSRREATVMGATHLATPAADRVAEFCKRHGFDDPREGWHEAIIPPTDDNATRH